MLYVFGDSYSHSIKHMAKSNKARDDKNPFIPLEDNWVNIVSKKLIDSVECVNHAVAGASNEYIFHTLMSYASDFKAGDNIIVQLTSRQRRWLIEDHPEFSNFMMEDRKNTLSSAQEAAIKSYAKHLNSDVVDEAIYKACLYGATYIGKMLGEMCWETGTESGIKVLVLPGFHEIGGVTGTLGDVCFGEFAGQEAKDAYYKSVSDCDSRWNHMSEDNHIILAEKVLSFFDNYTEVNLNTDFKKAIYT